VNTAICSQPFQVIGVSLELFRPEQRVGHVGQQERRHDRAEDHVEHGAASHVGAGARIDEGAREQHGTEKDEGKVEHGVIPN
jgi:hypothetical protein